MRDIKFRVWYTPESKMYYRGYQKLTHILLCEDDQGKEDGRGIPTKRASFHDCEMMECSDIEDVHGRLIFEGDLIEIRWQGKGGFGEVDSIPDMFKSRNLHPLHSLIQPFGIPDDAEGLTFEILGNRYEHPVLLERIKKLREKR